MMSDEEKSFSDVLEKNYSPETSEEEKIWIHTLIRDLKENFGFTIEENDNLFNKERGSEIVRDLTTQFNAWKSISAKLFNNSESYEDILPFVIGPIAKLCFYYWLRDSEIVSEVLRQVHNSNGQFSSIIDQISNQYEGTLSGSATIQERTQKEYLTVLYFLTHAHWAKLEFSGVRFVDLSLGESLRGPAVFWSTYYRNPKLLLLLLRHGAILAGSQSYPLDLNDVLKYLIRLLWHCLGPKLKASSPIIQGISANDVCLCLRFLLRGIRHIPKGTLQLTLMHFELGGRQIERHSHDFIRSLSEQGIVPSLVSRYLEPAGLRHLCRMAIRDALNRNWNLPFGVFSLPLPNVLQRYVNLSED